MILKTKKRLSKSGWQLSLIVLLVLSILIISGYAMRVNSVGWEYDSVQVKLPVMYEKLKDPLAKDPPRMQKNTISKYTPVVVMSEDAFYLGDTTAFTSGFHQVRNKVRIPHVEGSPQIRELLRMIKKWKRQRLVEFHIKDSPMLILLPSEQWPMAVVIQVVQILKKEKLTQYVVLGSHLEANG